MQKNLEKVGTFEEKKMICTCYDPQYHEITSHSNQNHGHKKDIPHYPRSQVHPKFSQIFKLTWSKVVCTCKIMLEFCPLSLNLAILHFFLP